MSSSKDKGLMCLSTLIKRICITHTVTNSHCDWAPRSLLVVNMSSNYWEHCTISMLVFETLHVLCTPPFAGNEFSPTQHPLYWITVSPCVFWHLTTFPVGLSLNTDCTATWHANSVFSQLYDDTNVLHVPIMWLNHWLDEATSSKICCHLIS
jgi:hypothetical protein